MPLLQPCRCRSLLQDWKHRTQESKVTACDTFSYHVVSDCFKRRSLSLDRLYRLLAATSLLSLYPLYLSSHSLHSLHIIVMDINPTPDEIFLSLSYDDAIPYAEQVAQIDTTSSSGEAEQFGHSRLADRIGNTRVYSLPETAGSRAGKVRW